MPTDEFNDNNGKCAGDEYTECIVYGLLLEKSPPTSLNGYKGDEFPLPRKHSPNIYFNHYYKSIPSDVCCIAAAAPGGGDDFASRHDDDDNNI